MSMSNPGCHFCRKFGSNPHGELDPVFDKTVWENDRFVVTPAMGSLVEGYLLIIPRVHYLSAASLPPRMITELSSIKTAIRKALTEHFMAPIFFEHGTVRGGGSVDHAHLHCVPFPQEFDLINALNQCSPKELTKIRKFDDIKQVEGRPYIYFESQTQEEFILTDISVPPQHIRMILARILNITDRWDWKKHPFRKNALVTLKTLDTSQLIV
jgi:ATP adenylyltransferase